VSDWYVAQRDGSFTLLLEPPPHFQHFSRHWHALT
jgi:hypothetical protein